jgi:hypothetical protein
VQIHVMYMQPRQHARQAARLVLTYPVLQSEMELLGLVKRTEYADLVKLVTWLFQVEMGVGRYVGSRICVSGSPMGWQGALGPNFCGF